MRIVTSDEDSKVKTSAQTKKNLKTKCTAEFIVRSWSLGIVNTVSRKVFFGGLKTPPFSLMFYEKFITCAKEIKCFRLLICRLNANTTE